MFDLFKMQDVLYVRKYTYMSWYTVNEMIINDYFRNVLLDTTGFLEQILNVKVHSE